MTDKDLLETKDNFLTCENCIFNDGCEKRFSGCIANFTDDFMMEQLNHLRYCEPAEYETLNEEQKKEFNEQLDSIEEDFNFMS